MKNACFALLGQCFKNFSVFPWTFFTVHCLVRSYHSQTHSQTHCVSRKNLHCSSSSQLQSSRKGMDFLIFSSYFVFIAFVFLIFESLWRFEISDDSDLGWVYFCEFDWMRFVDYDYVMLVTHAFMVVSHCWSCVSCLCCAVHIMLIVGHNGGYLWLCGVHRLHCT